MITLPVLKILIFNTFFDLGQGILFTPELYLDTELVTGGI
jgi:hypothetical protein